MAGRFGTASLVSHMHLMRYCVDEGDVEIPSPSRLGGILGGGPKSRQVGKFCGFRSYSRNPLG